eukprot:TRINITY_DN99_c0_g6_i1.p2 TRINITY_DN99_c0_g6~~TRINITY_DN99_c0_g6_i1.p2  ORF type:complete len:465 (+),score=177.16 TRINITY_DN99_c0_g6_i1:118-1512(+)
MADFFGQPGAEGETFPDFFARSSDMSSWLDVQPFSGSDDFDGTESESGSSSLSDPSSPAMSPCGSGDFAPFELLSSFSGHGVCQPSSFAASSASEPPSPAPYASLGAASGAPFLAGGSLPAMLPGLPGPFPSELVTPQLLHYYFTHYPHLFQIPKGAQQAKSGKRSRADEDITPPLKRAKPIRPKVVEAKGSVQCIGRNRKKSIQCRNAALMEYIGARPQYCAEHIELDPHSVYMKCRSPYQKEASDNKGCKEVVLKEFRFCYKHYPDSIADMIRNNEIPLIQRHAVRIEEIRNQLEQEAAIAKKVDSDLYQRKNKLIPKFAEMSKQVARALDILRTQNVIRPNEFETRPAESLSVSLASSCSFVADSPDMTPTMLGSASMDSADSDADFKSDFGSEDGTPRDGERFGFEDLINFGADFVQLPDVTVPALVPIKSEFACSGEVHGFNPFAAHGPVLSMTDFDLC